MQHKEQKILHCCVNYGKLMSHLCILVLPIHFKGVHGYTHTQRMYPHTYTRLYTCATAQGAVLQIKNYQVFHLSKTEGVVHLETCLALKLC